MGKLSNPMTKAYTNNREVNLPETQIKRLLPEHKLIPLRGHSHTVAVYLIDHYVGWHDITDSGYDSVKHWIKETNWKDEGY